MSGAGEELGEHSSAASLTRLAIFGALAVATLVLGYAGLSAYLLRKPEFGRAFLDVLYYDIQLFFVAAEPLKNGGPFPPALQIARFAGPMVTAYAVVELAAAVFSIQRQQLRARLARRHVVVCGSSWDAWLLVKRLRGDGATVVLVDPEPSNEVIARCRATRTPMVVGNPGDQAVLRSAGIARASTVYAFTPGSALNTAIAVAVRAAVSSQRGMLTCFALVRDRDLRAALLARGLGTAGGDRFRLVLFSTDEIAARALAERDPLVPAHSDPTHVVIIGLDDFGQTLAVELARQWRVQIGFGLPRFRLTLVTEDADEICAQLRYRFGALDSICELKPLIVGSVDDPDTLSRMNGALAMAPDRIYVCCADETIAIKLGLALLRSLRDHRVQITIRVDARETELNEAFHGVAGRLFDDAFGTLKVFGALEAACRPAAIREGVIVEEIARALHDSYVARAVEQGITTAENPAVRPWNELPEDLKEANRNHAHHIGEKLRAINCVAVPSFEMAMPFCYRTQPDEVELLARMEHGRWIAERLARGHRYGPRRAGEFHPNLVDWDELSEHDRDKDRAFVRALPGILAGAGFQILRLPDPVAGSPVGVSPPAPDRSPAT